MSDTRDNFSWTGKVTPYIPKEGTAIKQEQDSVNHPAHYTESGIECIDAIQAALTDDEFRGYIKGNCMKYIWRERHKNGDEDLKKASWYLHRYIEKCIDSTDKP